MNEIKTVLIQRYVSKNSLIPISLTVLVVVLLSNSELGQDDLRVLLAFMTLIPVYVVYRTYNGPCEIALILLSLSAVQLSIQDVSLARTLAIYSFWLLVVAIALIAIDRLISPKKDQ